MNDKTSGAVNWLLSSAEPAVRMLARRDLPGQDTARAGDVLDSPKVRALLSGQHEDGGFDVHPYPNWTSAHWRLVSLVELGIPAGEPRALRAAGTVLDWLTGAEHRSTVVTAGGLVRCHASQEGNALAVCSRRGLGRDPRGRDAGRVIGGLAMARWRLELRHPGTWAPLLLPRVAGPGVGTAGVLARNRGNRRT
jgi:hypothetical protein